MGARPRSARRYDARADNARAGDAVRLQDYRAQQAEAWLRRNHQQIRREFWLAKAEACTEERRNMATRPWAGR